MGWAWGRPHTRCYLALTTAFKVLPVPFHRLETEVPGTCEMPGLSQSPRLLCSKPPGPRTEARLIRATPGGSDPLP